MTNGSPDCLYCGSANRLYDTFGAAAYLSVEAKSDKHRDTYIRRLIAERRITFHKIGGKFVRIKKADLDAFRDAGRVETTI